MSARTENVFAFSPHRVAAMMLRYWYLLRSSWPRLIELVYWPTVQMITWGFLQFYVMQNAGFFARAGGTFIGYKKAVPDRIGDDQPDGWQRRGNIRYACR